MITDELVDSAYALGWSVVQRMPEPLARLLFTEIADRSWRRRGRGVLQLERNLRRVVGQNVSEDELRELSRAGMRSAMRYYMEAFRLPATSQERIDAGMNIENFERVIKTHDEGRGVVLALPHMGNYDHAAAWMVGQGYPFTTVAEHLKPESLAKRFLDYRRGLGMEVLPHDGDDVFGTLAQRMRSGGIACLVGERDLSGKGVEVEFFGETAKMPAGSAALAVTTGAALFPATLWFEGSGWGVRVHDEIPVPADGERTEKARAMTQSLAHVWETGIAEHPQDWHMLQRIWLADVGKRGGTG
jgi:KDO2-lipid IV(A) lauroyltransferase